MNFAPVDWVVEMMVELMKLPAAAKTYVVSHPKPPTAKWVISQGLKSLGIQGVIVRQKGVNKKPDTALQQALESELKHYLTYITVDCLVPSTLKSVLGTKYRHPPIMTSNFLEMILKNAMQHNFGKE